MITITVKVIPIKKLNFSSTAHHNHVFRLVVLWQKPKPTSS